MSNLISPDGQSWRATSPAEVVRLKSRGYTEAPAIDPADKAVGDVLAYVEEHPEQADAVVALEKAGKNRKTIVGSEA